MKIERIKKNHKKEIVIGGLILVSIVSAITLVTTRAKYRVTQNIKLAKGTVNYKVPDLRVVAVNISEDGNNYTNTNDIPTNGYELNSSKSICKVYDGTTSIEEAPKDNNVTIEYKEGKINILGVSKNHTRCYLYFDKKTEIPASTVVANIASITKTGTPNFANVATTNEGVYSVSDGMYGGTSYYFRGAATTNHVVFANKCWRIVRINGDGSIRLIYNGTPSNGTCTGNGSNSGSVVMGSTNADNRYATSGELNDNSSYVGWTYTLSSQRPTLSKDANGITIGGTESNAKVQTEKWFNNNSNFTDVQRAQVAMGKFCNDRSVGSGTYSATGSTFHYRGHTRLVTSKTPTLECPNGDVYELKVGAITSNEVMYAGGTTTNNTSYYLYNGQVYWTMSPYSWNGGHAYVFYVDSGGSLSNDWVSATSKGLRPVINLKADTTFATGGDGTQNNPYVVS